MMAKRIPRDVERLACEYHKDVVARKRLGDQHAEYHSQAPKNKAYKKMLDVGMTSREVVKAFRLLERRCGPRRR